MKLQIEISSSDERIWNAAIYAVDDFLEDRIRQRKVHILSSYRAARTLAGAVYNILRRLRRQLKEAP